MKTGRFSPKKMGTKGPFLKPFTRTHSNRRKILEKSGGKRRPERPDFGKESSSVAENATDLREGQ
ncbi:hypothetical protein D7V91_04560 [bacterium 1xD42-67]|nr:hypothetical protein D7V91_04560 [bacterium 1xD42-67]